MADQIQSNDGMMLGMGQRAWHGKGAVIDGLATAAEALEHAKMDWQVLKAPAEYTIPDPNSNDGIRLVMPGKSITYRNDDNTALGFVGNDFSVLQNDEVFGMFDPIFDGDQAVYETVGSLFGGKKVFVTARLPKGQIMVGGKDAVESYLLITNSHDGTSAVTAKLINTRVVCNNTLTAALGEKGRELRIRHNKNMHVRVKEAMMVMGLANKKAHTMGEIYDAMANTTMSDANVKEFLERCFKESIAPAPKARKTKLIIDSAEAEAIEAANEEKKKKDFYLLTASKELYETSPTVTRGNLWGAFNSLTEAVNHKRQQRQRIGGNDSIDNELNSLFYGLSGNLMTVALVEAGKVMNARGAGSGAKELASMALPV